MEIISRPGGKATSLNLDKLWRTEEELAHQESFDLKIANDEISDRSYSVSPRLCAH